MKIYKMKINEVNLIIPKQINLSKLKYVVVLARISRARKIPTGFQFQLQLLAKLELGKAQLQLV